MTTLRQFRWISTLLVAVIALAWLGASNHCALAAFETAKKTAHACCHNKEQGKPQQMPCCAEFNVPIPEHLAVPIAQFHMLQPTGFTAPRIASVEPALLRTEFFATGPPRALGFAELILNRSLFAHAPPCPGA